MFKMFSFRRLLSVVKSNDDQQSLGDERSQIEISDDSGEANSRNNHNNGADYDQDSGSEKKKRKREQDEDLIEMSPPEKIAKTSSPNGKKSIYDQSNTNQSRKSLAFPKKKEQDAGDLPNLTTTSNIVQKYRAKSSPPPPARESVPVPGKVKAKSPRSNGTRAHPQPKLEENEDIIEDEQEIDHEMYNNNEEDIIDEANAEETIQELAHPKVTEKQIQAPQSPQSKGIFGRLFSGVKQYVSSDTAVPAPVVEEPSRKQDEPQADANIVEEPKKAVEKENIAEETKEIVAENNLVEEVAALKEQTKFSLETPVYVSDEIDVNEIIEKKPKSKKLRRLKRNSLDGDDQIEEISSDEERPKGKLTIKEAISRIKAGKKKEIVIEDYDEDMEEIPPPEEPEPKPKTKANSKQNGNLRLPYSSSKSQEPLKTIYKPRGNANVNNNNINNENGEKDEEEYIDDRKLYDTNDDNVPIKSYSAFMAQLSSSKSIVLEGVEYKQGDYVILNGGEENWFCRIEDIKTEDDERKIVVRWFYEPAKHFKWEDDDLQDFEPNELVSSNHFDENGEDTILEKCAIYHLEEYKSVLRKREQAAKNGEDAEPKMKEFFYKYFYDLETGEVVDLAKKKTKAIRNKRQKINVKDHAKLKGSLAERFLVVPQSFLDTRQGNWRQRNQMWLSLGINRSRGIEMKKGSYTIHAAHMRDSQFYDKKSKKEAELGRKLTTKEFKEQHWDKAITYADVSVFDPTLAEISFRWFCPPSGRVLDPFAGSIRGVVASCLGLEYTGIELRKDQIIQNKYQLQRIRTKIPATWIEGDSRNITDLVANHYQLDPKDIKEEDKFDFVFSCPPFYDLEIYSDDPYDLSTLPSYEEFFNDYSKIIQQTAALLKENRFAVFVVCDFRDRQGIGQSIPFVADTIRAFENAGMQYYNELILVNHLGSKRFTVQKMYNSSKKIARNHQNVLVFVKGDPKMAYTLQDSEYNIDEIIKNNIEQILPVGSEEVDVEE